MTLALAGRIAASQRRADPLVKKLQPLIHRAVRPKRVRNFLDGVWLGAPLLRQVEARNPWHGCKQG